ncbi:CHASE domain-containing protein [Massilia sp. IC2-477]|uniref:CHASE domain-containing protein n=1 Tax=Massilia sp. IC2-477 TaxID=2887198 RepID=UPI001D11D102|nr:CHASE domain-containing protein [Massilia sp. IC2-477]MCC2958504.1 CHASE domain-containing protein [Massilia sp. IC2-477]
MDSLSTGSKSRDAVAEAAQAAVDGAGPATQSASAAPWVAGLALALAVGALCYRVASSAVEYDARRRFETVSSLAQERISSAIASYARVVRGMSALHAAGERPLTRLRLHRYVQALDLQGQFPAIEAVNYVAHVPDAQREAFIAAVRADRSVNPAGNPHFNIWPAGRRPSYAVITWVEPEAQANDRIGFDIAAQPFIAGVLARARDLGAMSASGNPVRLQHPTPHTALGMRLPLYLGGGVPATVEERRLRYMGSIGIAFSVDELVRRALGPQARQPVALSLYSENGPAGPGGAALQLEADDRLLVGRELRVDGREAQAAGGRFTTLLPIDYVGTRWKAHFSADRAAMAVGSDRYLPLLAFASGFGVSLLGFALIFNLMRSRRAALDQRLLLDSVLDNLDAYVYLKDGARRFRYVNAKTAALIGRPAENIVGQRDLDVVSGPLADGTWQRDRAVLESGERYACQAELPLRDGSVRQMWSVRVPLHPEGEMPAVLCISTDVTVLHELKARADAANRAKSDFLSNMSHEIRTPMNSIIGMTHLALQAHPAPQLRGYLDKIFHSGQHLLGIINDILDFSKIEAGKLELATRSFMLDAVMRNVEQQLGQAAGAKGLGFDLEIAPELMRPLRGDPLRLEQVLLNFAGNAVKFSEHGRIGLRARLEHAFGPELLVRFEVQDCGIGIEPDKLDSLFTPFHQADPSATRRHGGTGLGLVISKQLAELMHGAVGVESSPGRGSTFWFTARLGLEDGVAAGLGAAPAQHADGAMRLDGCAVLLVEDNPFNQQVARELLAQAGAVVSVAGNGVEALEAMARERFDCVLMDVQMPVMDGLEATRRIRSDPRLAGTLVIAMTANAGVEDRARCLQAGMDEFLTKPVVPELLGATIARCLGRSTAPAPDLVAAPAPGSGALDFGALGASFGDDGERMRKYAYLFVSTARNALDQLDALLLAGDMAGVAAVAHRIKSSARTVGAMGFAALCEELESQAARPAQARALAARLRAQLGRIEREVTTRLGTRVHDRP